MILKSKKGLKSPYSRIIFGLSVADMMQSFGIFISPWTSPRNESPYALWSIGTNATCEATGFFLSVGTGAVPFYIFFLVFYFLRKVKWKVRAKDFRSQELILHGLIWVYNIVCSIIPTIRGKRRYTLVFWVVAACAQLCKLSHSLYTLLNIMFY